MRGTNVDEVGCGAVTVKVALAQSKLFGRLHDVADLTAPLVLR